MDLKTKQNEIQHEVYEQINSAIALSAVTLFTENPGMTSFGWRQWDDRDSLFSEGTFRDTLATPDINGNDGVEIYDVTMIGLQQTVAKFLEQFDPQLLLVAFGRKQEVVVYADLTIEVTEYDPYGFGTEEFQESSIFEATV